MPESSSIQTIPSAGEKQRSLDLVRHRRCPHCDETISLSDAISMVQGAGIVGSMEVEIESGARLILPIPEINPQAMRVIEPLWPEIARRDRLDLASAVTGRRTPNCRTR
jgi:hypothetical protein